MANSQQRNTRGLQNSLRTDLRYLKNNLVASTSDEERMAIYSLLDDSLKIEGGKRIEGRRTKLQIFWSKKGG